MLLLENVGESVELHGHGVQGWVCYFLETFFLAMKKQ